MRQGGLSRRDEDEMRAWVHHMLEEESSINNQPCNMRAIIFGMASDLIHTKEDKSRGGSTQGGSRL